MEGSSTAGVAQGWTSSAGTASLSTVPSERIEGLKSQKIALSAQTLNFSQTVSTISGLSGMQGSAGFSYKIPSTLTTAFLRVSVDGSPQVVIDAARLQLDNKWHQIEIPFIFGNTNVKIEYGTSGNVTGDFFTDSSYIQQGLGNGAKIIGGAVDTIESIGSPSSSFGSTDQTVLDANITKNDSGRCGILTDNAVNGTFYTAIKPCILNISVNAKSGTPQGNTAFSITRNSTNTTSGFDGALTYQVNYLNGYEQEFSASVVMSIGDIFRIQRNAPSQNLELSQMTLTAQETISNDSYIQSFSQDTLAVYTTGSASGSNPINFDILVVDTKNLVTTGGAWKFTAQEAGVYQVNAQARATANIGNAALTLYKNNIAYAILTQYDGFATEYREGAGGALVYLLAGEYLSVGFGGSLNNGTISIAKVATSGLIYGSFAGVPSVTGYTGKIDTFSFSYGTTNATTVCSASPCSYLDQIGTSVASVTRSAGGIYSLNTVATYAKLKCNGNAGNGLEIQFPTSFCSNCSSLAFQSDNFSLAFDSFGTITCQGSY
jgi:hypothetical protein